MSDAEGSHWLRNNEYLLMLLAVSLVAQLGVLAAMMSSGRVSVVHSGPAATTAAKCHGRRSLAAAKADRAPNTQANGLRAQVETVEPVAASTAAPATTARAEPSAKASQWRRALIRPASAEPARS